MKTKIYFLLSRLGITANYCGFFYTAYAVSLAADDIEVLQLITKRLYPDVAKYYKTSIENVERNVRTVASIAWKKNAPFLMQLTGRTLTKQPSAAEFIAILTTALLYLEEVPPTEPA